MTRLCHPHTRLPTNLCSSTYEAAHESVIMPIGGWSTLVRIGLAGVAAGGLWWRCNQNGDAATYDYKCSIRISPSMTRAAETSKRRDTLTRPWCKRNAPNACATRGEGCRAKQRLSNVHDSVSKGVRKHHGKLSPSVVVGGNAHYIAIAPTMTRAAKTFNLGDTLTRAWCKRNLFANACATCGKRCGSIQRLRKHLCELQHFQSAEEIKGQSKKAIRVYNKNKTKKNLKRALKLGTKDANLIHVFRYTLLCPKHTT